MPTNTVQQGSVDDCLSTSCARAQPLFYLNNVFILRKLDLILLLLELRGIWFYECLYNNLYYTKKCRTSRRWICFRPEGAARQSASTNQQTTAPGKFGNLRRSAPRQRYRCRAHWRPCCGLTFNIGSRTQAGFCCDEGRVATAFEGERSARGREASAAQTRDCRRSRADMHSGTAWLPNCQFQLKILHPLNLMFGPP